MTSSMLEVASGVHRIPLFGSHTINAYLVGDILIDAGIRGSVTKLERALQHHKLRAHALTHVHSDHQGASHGICSSRQIPLWVHESEAGIMERGVLIENTPNNPITRLQRRFWQGLAHPVECALRAGDDLNGFEVLETPGHSKGHISYWRESDRVLIVGDVMTKMNILTGQTGLNEPLKLYTLDAVQNRQNIRRLAKLEPRLALFGHGKPLRDPEALARFAATLQNP
jgi:hydroxyacylglutathione hydrolase